MEISENILKSAEWVSYEDLAQRVRTAMIAGAEVSTLDTIQATAKGSLFGSKVFEYRSRYRLFVGKANGAKVAYLYDDNEKKVWQINKSELKSFYSKIEELVSREKAYPTRK